MIKFILVLAVAQLLFYAEGGLQLTDYSKCIEPNCAIVLDTTLPDTFRICITNETRCTTLGKLRQTVK